ncbi:hypothetical protein [Deefgea rivuli]|uniref:hypothetical protein n=1 Tax=Deefgea rivuli TaxID=400948 RepID=UPI0004860D41|nr:hypothetical protein [Deefgea rivuli]
MDAIEKIQELARDADIAITESANVATAIPFCIEALTIINGHPHLRTQFVGALTQINYPEFPSICIHALRWPELKVAFEEKYSKAVSMNDWRGESAIRPILEAFDDDWSDAKDFYCELFSKTTL